MILSQLLTVTGIASFAVGQHHSKGITKLSEKRRSSDHVPRTITIDDTPEVKSKLKRRLGAPDGDADAKIGITPQIVGGTTAAVGEFPWFASVTQFSGSICGAALIAPDVLITAAHCASAFNSGAIVGAYDFQSAQTTGAERVRVVEMREHPGFSQFFDGRDDIMVMKISPPITDRAPVPLMLDTEDPVDGATLTAMGFGHTSYQGQTSDTLLKAELEKVSDKTCWSIYGISSNIIVCAINEQPLRSTCNGDSGGPLIDSSGALVGLVSFGVECGEKGFPTGFTRISGFKGWLEENVCPISESPPSSLNCANVASDTCSSEESDYKTCLRTELSTTSAEACANCLNNAWPQNTQCGASEDFRCEGPGDCGCGTCSTKLTTYIKCLTGCQGACPATGGGTNDNNPGGNNDPPVNPPANDDPPASGSCTNEENRYQQCLNGLWPLQSWWCIHCVNSNWPMSAQTCDDYDQLRCSAVDDCGCSSCSDEIKDYLKCNAGCTTDC